MSFVLLLVGIVLSLVSAILWIAVGSYVGQLQDSKLLSTFYSCCCCLCSIQLCCSACPCTVKYCKEEAKAGYSILCLFCHPLIIVNAVKPLLSGLLNANDSIACPCILQYLIVFLFVFFVSR